MVVIGTARAPRAGLAWLNLASGDFRVTECAPGQLESELHRIAPAEVICADSAEFDFPFESARTRVPDWHFETDSARAHLLAHFKTDTLAGFDVEDMPAGVCAAGALLRYAARTQSQALAHVQTLSAERPGQYVLLDPVTRRNLELTQTLSGEDSPTLFSLLDDCRTPMGSRLLRRWLHHPLRENEPAQARQQAISALLAGRMDVEQTFGGSGFGSAGLLESLRGALNAFPDIERIATRLALRSVRPRELASLRDALQALPTLREQVEPMADSPRLGDLVSHLSVDPALAALLVRAIAAEPAVAIRDGGVLAGFDSELDELRAGRRRRRLPGAAGSPRTRAHRHCHPARRIQPCAWLLHRSHQGPDGESAGRLPPPPDPEKNAERYIARTQDLGRQRCCRRRTARWPARSGCSSNCSTCWPSTCARCRTAPPPWPNWMRWPRWPSTRAATTGSRPNCPSRPTSTSRPGATRGGTRDRALHAQRLPAGARPPHAGHHRPEHGR